VRANGRANECECEQVLASLRGSEPTGGRASASQQVDERGREGVLASVSKS